MTRKRKSVRKYGGANPMLAKIAAQAIGTRIEEMTPLGEDGVVKGNGLMQIERDKLLNGQGDDESVKCLNVWFCHTLIVLAERYRKGSKTLKLGMRLLVYGRRALNRCWFRHARGEPFYLTEDERMDFEDAFDLAISVSSSFCKAELRFAFATVDKRAKRLAKRYALLQKV